MADNKGNNSSLVAVGLNLVIAVNNLNKTVGTVFPLASAAVAGSAGGATGTYLAITIDGVPYKLALLAP